MSRTNWKALIPGILLLAIASLLAVTGFDEVQQYKKNSGRRTAVADAEVYAAAEEVSKSGVIESWEVGYEFLSDDVKGSNYSIRAQSKWIKEERARSVKERVPMGSIDEAGLPEAPEGKSYYLKLQTLTPEDYAKIGLGISKVNYDPNFPDNSILAATSPPSFARLYVLAPFLGVIGSLLFLVSIWGWFRKAETELQ